jgi:type VI secretion system protein VasG
VLRLDRPTDVLVRRGSISVYDSAPRALLPTGAERERLKIFPPALLGPIISTSTTVAGVVLLQVGRIGQRIRDNHDTAFVYDQAVVDHVALRCSDPDAGARMVDNILTNAALPSLPREFPGACLAGRA